MVIELPELLLVRQNCRDILDDTGSFANKADSTEAMWKIFTENWQYAYQIEVFSRL